KREAEDALHLAGGNNKYIEALCGIVLALAGDTVQAKRIADDLASRAPQNTSIQYQYLPMLRGAIALQTGKAPKAIKESEIGTPYELGSPVWMAFLRLYSVYLRGQFFLAAHQHDLAAKEFQKIFDHRGLVANEPIGALAHLGLGRAYAMAGDSSKARTAYQDFLALWE